MCVGCMDGTARLVNLTSKKAVYVIDHNEDDEARAVVAPQAAEGGEGEGDDEGDEEEGSTSVERCVVAAGFTLWEEGRCTVSSCSP